jgi:hypothetical protein
MEPKKGRKVHHRRQGEDELRDGVQIHETAVEEGLQRFVRFADAIDGGAGVVVLLPAHRQVQGLVIPLLEEIAA